uniref:Uncharacterized protein n=1 Tax=Saimiri boliviensis boliviensis TaxID=39432 RepID=A0A2K6SD84_SAIBB
LFTPDGDAASPALRSTSFLIVDSPASTSQVSEKILPKDSNIISCLSSSLPASPTDFGLASPTIMTSERQPFWAICLIWKYQLYSRGLPQKPGGRIDRQRSASP